MPSHATAQCILATTQGAHVPLARVSASGRLDGLMFELTVEQHYRNTSTVPIESVYTFPLPLNAVLLAFELELNGVTHVAKAFGKQQAERKYETAIDSGDSAALLVSNGNGLFTVNVANLMPGEAAVIRYRYAELLRAHRSHVRVNIPTAIAPRYGKPSDARIEGPAVPGVDVLAEYPFDLRLELVGVIDAGSVQSPSHTITTTPTTTGLSVEIARRGFLDRDFVLLLDSPVACAGTLVAADGQGFVSLASAVVESGSGEDRPLVVKILLDCSGSMAGDSIESAKRALAKLLEGMRPSDRFSLSRFGSSVVEVTEGLEPGDAHTLEPLKHIVARIAADLGGTEMAAAVQATIDIRVPEGSQSDLVLITDGEVYAVDQVVETAQRSGHRLFVVAIGAAPNEALARKVSELTHGACDFVAAGEAVEPAILRMFGRLRATPRKVVRVQWPVEPLWTGALPSAVFPNETLHVMAGFSTPPTDRVRIFFEAQDGTLGEVTLPVAAHKTSGDALSRIAAARRLSSLSADEARKLAIQYQLVSEFTSLVLVAERAEGAKAQEIPATVAVPHMLAAGWGGSARAAAGAPRALMLRSRSVDMMEMNDESMSSFRMVLDDDVDDSRSARQSFKVEFDSIRKPLLAALQKRLEAGGALPVSLEQLEAIHALPMSLRVMLRTQLKLHGASPAIVIRAFLELLDRESGLIEFPPVNEVERRQLRLVRRALEKNLQGANR